MIEKQRNKKSCQDAARRNVGLAVLAERAANVHGSDADTSKADRHVHDRADAEARDERVIRESFAQLCFVSGDIDLAAIEHDLAPPRAFLLLSPTDRIGRGIAAVEALDRSLRGDVAKHGE